MQPVEGSCQQACRGASGRQSGQLLAPATGRYVAEDSAGTPIECRVADKKDIRAYGNADSSRRERHRWLPVVKDAQARIDEGYELANNNVLGIAGLRNATAKEGYRCCGAAVKVCSAINVPI